MEDKKLKTILIVDDEIDVLKFLTAALMRAHYEVIATPLGQEAIRYAKCLNPDLIILDILLPDIEGGKVAETLAQDPATAKIPIIFLTGIITKKGENFLKRHTGKRDIMAKPISTFELLQKVEKFFSAEIKECNV